MRAVGGITTCLLLSLFLACVATAQELYAAAPLTLGECIQRALARGFDMRIEQESLFIARNNLPVAQAAFDPELSATTSRSASRFGLSATDPALNNVDSDVRSTRVGIAKRLQLGTMLSLSAGLDRSRIDATTAALNPAYGSDVALSLSQPLLQGFGSKINMLGVKSAEISVVAAERTYEDRALDVIASTENAYYFLAGAREQLSVFETGRSLAERLLREAESRQAAGMATHVDVLQAQVGLANARLRVVDAQRAVQDGEDVLLTLIGESVLDTPVGPLALNSEKGSEPLEVESSYASALERSPALRAARANVELAKLDITAAEDELKPYVSIDVDVGLSGSDRYRREAVARTLEADSNAWQAGITVSYPIGRRAQKARWSQSRAALNRETLRMQQLEQDILVLVREAVREVNSGRERVEIASLAAQLSLRQYEAEMERYRVGLSTSRRVLEAQTDLESARVAHLQARLDALQARASLQRIEGSALERYNVVLPAFLSGQGRER